MLGPALGRQAIFVLSIEQPLWRGHLVVLFLATAAFGPYITPGIRTEQAAVYGVFMLLLISPAWLRIRPTREGLLVAGLWTVLASVGAIGGLFPPPNNTPYPIGNLLAGIDNFALPLVVMLIMWLLLASGGQSEKLLRRICEVLVIAMCGNAGLAVLMVGGHNLDLASFYNGDGSESVSYLASTLGRYSGAINQPAEAGLLYSLALLAAVYLLRRKAVLLATAVTILAVGGVLTVSKVFLLAGCPVVLWQLATAQGGRRRRAAVFAGAVLLMYETVRSGVLPEWTGRAYLLRLLPTGGQDTIGLYTAGRFGDTSTLAGVTDAVMDTTPTFGLGAAGLRVPYDNGWVETIVVSGAVGAVAYTLVLIVLGVAWWRRRGRTSRGESRLAGGMLLVLVAASAGVPSLTANRCATIVWMLLTVLLLSQPAGEPARACELASRLHLRVARTRP